MNRQQRRAGTKLGARGGSAYSRRLADERYRLAVAQHQSGNFREAEKLYRQTVKICPGHAPSLHAIGVIALQTGSPDAAVAAFRKVIAANPGLAEAHDNLGLALLTLGWIDEAIASSERALQLKPDSAAAHNNLGLALQKMDRHQEAIRHFERALVIRQDARAQQNLAISLWALNRYEEAVTCFEAALAGGQNSTELQRNLGTVLLMLGRTDEACIRLLRAVELDPCQPASYRRLAEARRITLQDPLFHRMENLVDNINTLTPADQIELHFAMGKVLADAGEHSDSFQHYLAGNRLKRSHTDYDETRALNQLERIRVACSSEFLEQHRDSGELSSVPIFIVGMPRSGTTLVEQILATHPAVAAAGERMDFTIIAHRLLSSGQSTFSFLDHLHDVPGAKLRQLGSEYVATLRAIYPTAKRIVDKMPANFRYLGLIRAALPNARIIHLRRNSIDTCLSCFSKLFDGSQPFAYDLSELGRYWNAYDRLMGHWRKVLPEGSMLEVQYEQLVEQFDTQARRLIAYCDLEWDPACLSFYKTERPVETASWVQVRQPIYRSSVGRWRPEEAVLRPLLDALRGSQINPSISA